LALTVTEIMTGSTFFFQKATDGTYCPSSLPHPSLIPPSSLPHPPIPPSSLPHLSSSSSFLVLVPHSPIETKDLMESMMADLQSRGWDSKPVHVPARGDWVVAKFSVDNNWYRAEVLKVVNPNKENPEAQQFELRYVDYGNVRNFF
jgi:hypothetical protein